MLHPLFFSLRHITPGTCLMHALLSSYHFAVLQQICVLHVPYNAVALSPALCQNHHILHSHLFEGILCNLSKPCPDLHDLFLHYNQTTLFFVCCRDIPNSNPGAFSLSSFHLTLLW